MSMAAISILIGQEKTATLCKQQIMDNRRDWIGTCWRDRRNLVEIYDVTKIRSAITSLSQCKSNCPKVLASSLQKPMPPY